MNKVPERYKEIRQFIEGLYTSQKLLGENSTLAFLRHDTYWSSHVTFVENNKKIVFSIRYMKDKDEVWVISNLYSTYSNYHKWLYNTLCFDLKQNGYDCIEVENRTSRYGHNIFVKVKLDKNKDYNEVYDIYMLFKEYRGKLEERGAI